MMIASEVVALALALQAFEPLADGTKQPWRATTLQMAWRVERQGNFETGGKTCSVVSIGKNVTVRFFKRHMAARPGVSVRIGFDNQPASLRYLRVNRKIFQNNKDSFVGPVAEDIVERLKSPGEFAFEWARRPDYAKRPGLFGTGDFAVRVKQCLRWLNGRRVWKVPGLLAVGSKLSLQHSVFPFATVHGCIPDASPPCRKKEP